MTAAKKAEWDEQAARKAYYAALGTFQSLCPPIPKTKEVLNRDKSVRYRYAPLDSIIKLIGKPLHEQGFTYRWDIKPGEDGPDVTCYLNHVDGWQESSTFHVPTFAGYGTNVAQDAGSASTFGRRNSLANVLGLVFDEDDDGISAATPNSERLIYHNKVATEWLSPILQIKDSISGGGDWEAAAECVAEMPRKVFNTLWVAPSNGGFWSTEERDYMKNNTEFKELVHKLRLESGWYDLEENSL